MPFTKLDQHALASLDETRLLDALHTLLRFPSVTGYEADAQRWLARHMRELGLEVDLWPIDVEMTRQQAGFPGLEVDRSQHEALGLVGKWQGSGGAGKLLVFNGHIDVVPAGD